MNLNLNFNTQYQHFVDKTIQNITKTNITLKIFQYSYIIESRFPPSLKPPDLWLLKILNSKENLNLITTWTTTTWIWLQLYAYDYKAYIMNMNL